MCAPGTKVRREDAVGLEVAEADHRCARKQTEVEPLCQPPLASLRVRARVLGAEDGLGLEPSDLFDHVAGDHLEAGNAGEQAVEEVESSPRGREGRVANEEGDDAICFAAGRCERRVVVHPQVAREQDDGGLHRGSLPLMDFELTDEQRLIQDTVRTFVDERVLPVAIQNDIDHKLDLELIEGMAELGILGIVIPEEYGGAGLDFVAEALSCEEIERGEAAFRTLISVHVGLNSLSLLKYGTEEQKQRWLTPQAKGEKLACFGLTEPAAGSDVAAMRSTARREGDVFVLNGQKNWISYASVADHALVFAKTDPAAGHKGISAFVLEKGMKGFTTQDTEHKLGIWAGSTGELFFENLEVPAENLIGEEGQGFEIAMHSLDQGRFTVAAGACGVVRACLERSVGYARERETFGQAIGKYQFVQDMIAKMVLGYETSKLLVMQAAWMKNEGKRNTRETSLAKWHATESAFEAAHLAIQVFGSYGYSGEYGIERYFRNARAPIIYEGTTQIHKMMQAEHALGYRRLNGRGGEASPICSWAPALSPVHAGA